MELNSRERVLASINHSEPDKIPVDLGSNPSSGISAIAYDNLKKYLGMNHPTRVYDVVQQLAQPDQEIIDRFGLDIIDIGREFNTSDNDWYNYTLANGGTAQYPVWYKPQQSDDGSWFTTDENGLMLSKMPIGATFFDQTYFPYVDGFPSDYAELPHVMQKIMWARHAHSPWDHAGEKDFWKQLRTKALFLKENTDKALFISAGCNLFEFGTMLRRMDNFFMDLLMNQDEFGKDITFWGGGIDTAGVLNKATTKEVREHVLKRCEIFSKGGGFVFNTVHNIMPDVPPKNIAAMFDAVKEFNK